MVKDGIAKVLSSQIMFFIICFVTIIFWILTPVFLNEYKLPIAAWYPYVDIQNPFIFGFCVVYQMAGIAFSASYNISIDFMAIGIICLMDSQVRILTSRLPKIGNGNCEKSEFRGSYKDEKYRELEKKLERISNERNKNYSEIVHCFVHYEKILKITREIEDIYKESTFGQFCASCFIICMTLFQLANGVQSIVKMFSLVSYLMAMLFQIGVFCWFGNDLSFSVSL